MSCTEIYAFDKAGNAYLYSEVRNAWRGAMAVWDIMEDRHLPMYIPGFIKCCNWYRPGMPAEEIERRNGFKLRRMSISMSTNEKPDPADEIWALADNPDVPKHERIVMHTTFDRCLVKREDIRRVVDAFRQFEGNTSLKEQADILELMAADPEIIAVGWNQTSVNGGNWANAGGYDENGEWIPYNCLTMDRHYWLFDEMEGARKE